MTYLEVKYLPIRIKKYPSKIQRMWMKVFNKTYSNVLKKTNNKEDAEKQSFKMANAIIKKNIEKFGVLRYGQRANMQYIIDSFLGQT